MEENFSPKQVAEALNVSESSVKRWCDRGAICTSKTHGGHRRITLDGLMEFLASTNRQLLDPSSLGLSGMVLAQQSTNGDPEADRRELNLPLLRQHFEEALIRGDEKLSRKILSHWYASCQSFSKISDELIAPAFHRIGELWHTSEIEVFQERRACEICIRLVHEFRRLMVEPLASSPYAIGCSLSGDHYSIPGQLIEVVLREAGWRACNIGSNLPLKSLEAAVHRECPQLVWLSVSHTFNAKQFIQEIHEFSHAIPQEVTFVVGGRALNDELRPQLRYTAHCDTLQQLSTLARTLRNSTRDSRSQSYLPMQNRPKSESSTSSV